MNVDRRCSRSQREREGILSPSSWGGPLKLLWVMSGKAWRTSLKMPHSFSLSGFNLQHLFQEFLQGYVIYRTP